MRKLFLARLKELQGRQSVSAFARLLEMPQTTLNSYVLGVRKSSVELIKRICLKCGVSADWLLGLSEDRGGARTAAPTVAATKTDRVEQDSTLSLELSAIRRQLEMQQREIAALKQLNQPSSACCG